MGGDHAEDKFVRFMQPLTDMADALLQAFDSDPAKIKWHMVGLLRDLRGVSSSADESRHYVMFFAWLFPNRFSLFIKTAEWFWDDPDVAIPLLRLLSELVANRGSRIAFPISSSGGQILLVEVCRCLIAWSRGHILRLKERLGGSTLTENGHKAEDRLSFDRLRDLVEEMASESSGESNLNAGVKLHPGACGAGITWNMTNTEIKCVSIASTTLTRMIAGRFGNLSVFDLYRDSSLKDVRRGAFCFIVLSGLCFAFWSNAAKAG